MSAAIKHEPQTCGKRDCTNVVKRGQLCDPCRGIKPEVSSLGFYGVAPQPDPFRPPTAGMYRHSDPYRHSDGRNYDGTRGLSITPPQSYSTSSPSSYRFNQRGYGPSYGHGSAQPPPKEARQFITGIHGSIPLEHPHELTLTVPSPLDHSRALLKHISLSAIPGDDPVLVTCVHVMGESFFGTLSADTGYLITDVVEILVGRVVPVHSPAQVTFRAARSFPAHSPPMVFVNAYYEVEDEIIR